MTDAPPEKEPVTVIACGPKLTCPDGTPHDYSSWVWEKNSGTAVCSKCGHRSIDDSYWMD